jgi:predicted HTH transcriptional regulator
MKALREAIANALVHRDYSINSQSAYIYLRIFDDRIEILNPGELYGSNRLEYLGTDRKMEVRNNVIIRLLEETSDVVENRHTGIATMREEMKKAKLPEPEFETLRDTFKVTFRKKISDVIEEEFTDKFTENFTKNFTKNEKKILKALSSNPNITQAKLSTDIGVSKRTVTTIMKKSQNEKVIIRIGSIRKGYWKVI